MSGITPGAGFVTKTRLVPRVRFRHITTPLPWSRSVIVLISGSFQQGSNRRFKLSVALAARQRRAQFSVAVNQKVGRHDGFLHY